MVASLKPEALIGGRYRLDRSIAAGGMAEVWLATDIQLGRQVAVKYLKDHIADDETVVERFRREAQALAKLHHENIVPIYDIVEEGHRTFVVMKFVDGKSLREVLDEARRKDPEHRPARLGAALTVHIGRSIALALQHAHDQGIVHRDIKPGNILISSGGKVLLTDFGIAKAMHGGETETDLTNQNIMMGTAKYLSPEQVRGRPLDGRADIYSLGLVLYECLAGNVPFKGQNDQAIALQRLQRDPTPLAPLCPGVPILLTDVVHKMLRRKPESRYANGREVSSALQAALAGDPNAPTPDLGGNSRTPVGMDPLITGGIPIPPTARDLTPEPPTIATRPRATRDNSGDIEREQTPRTNRRPEHALPRSQQTNRSRGMLAVGLLVIAVLVTSWLLWSGLRSSPGVSPAPTDVAAAPVDTSPVTVVGLRSYDPNGDDSTENEAMVTALSDGNPATSWATLCYQNEYFGSKRGVGIVMQLSRPATGQVKTDVRTSPWRIEVFGAQALPESLEGWGEPLKVNNGTNSGPATFDVTTPASHVLVLFTQIGPSSQCSNANPFKGVLSELSFTAG